MLSAVWFPVTERQNCGYTIVGLHPYDDVERRFRHTDENRNDGLMALSGVLRLPHPPNVDVQYDLSFLSGGFGVFDNLAIALPADLTLWENVVAALGAVTLEQPGLDIVWAAELRWLMTLEEEPVPLRPTAVEFIDRSRREFQTECRLTGRILFPPGSDVNDWAVLWGNDSTLNYLGYSQG